MADISDKIINNLNNEVAINATKSIDEEQILKIIFSTVKKQKAKKSYVLE